MCTGVSIYIWIICVCVYTVHIEKWIDIWTLVYVNIYKSIFMCMSVRV